MQGSLEQRPNGRWSIRYRLPDGRQRRRTFTTKRAAERELRATIVGIEERNHVGADRSVTVGDLLPDWWEATAPSVKPRTAERYDLSRRMIAERIGSTRLSELDKDAVQRFVNGLTASGYAPRTVRSHYGVLALVIRDGVERGKLRPVPSPRLPRVERPQLTVPTPGEVELLAENSDARCSALVLVAGFTGMRQGELLGLHPRDVHLDHPDGPQLFVHRAMSKTTRNIESTKTGGVRTVVLPDIAAAAMRDQLAEHATAELVFPLTASTVQKSWERARVASGLPSVRFHDLRHAAASMLIAAGVNVKAVSVQLGHADAALTLKVYAHLLEPDARQTAQRLNDHLRSVRPAPALHVVE